MARIYQLVAGFRYGDAISDEALLLRSAARSHDFCSEIYCDPATIAPDAAGDACDAGLLPGIVRPDDVVLLHLSIGSPVNSLFTQLVCRKVILYHNVTPPAFFARLNPPIAQRLGNGLVQVEALAGSADVYLADSSYNAGELESMGYPPGVKVFPLVVDAKRFGPENSPVDEGVRRSFRDDGCVNILFVGRVAPNKRHDKLIEVFSFFQHYVEPRSRLIIAGTTNGLEAYKSLLLGSVHAHELKRVVFTDFLLTPKLNACYAASDAFLCMSDHEGFCAPLLEAMAWNMPVFANSMAAVPETMDGAGVLFDGASSAEIAETIGRVLSDKSLKEAVLEKQNLRLQKYRNRDVWKEFCSLVGM